MRLVTVVLLSVVLASPFVYMIGPEGVVIAVKGSVDWGH